MAASQAVYVNLDLKGNAIQNVADAVTGTDVPSWLQVQELVDGSIESASHVPASAAEDGGIVVAEGQVLSVDTVWLVTQIQENSANNLEAGFGIEITPGVAEGDPDTVAAKISGTTNNQLTIDAGGLFVPKTDLTGYYTKTEVDASQTLQNTAITNNANAIDAETTARTDADTALDLRIDALEGAVIDFPVDDVRGTDGQITVGETTDVFTVGIDPLYTSARDKYADDAVAEETARATGVEQGLQTAIDGVADDLATEATAREAADFLIDAAFKAADTQIRVDFAAADTSIRQDFVAADTALDDRITPLETASHKSASAADLSVVVGDKDSQTIGVKLSAKTDNILKLHTDVAGNDAGLYVPPPAAVSIPVSEVTGTTGEITVTPTGTVFKVGIDGAYTTARDDAAQAKVDAAVTTLNQAIALKVDTTTFNTAVGDLEAADDALDLKIGANTAEINTLKTASHKAATAGSGIAAIDTNQVIAVDSTVVRTDGSAPFTAVQAGVDPTLPAHLTTKAYVDEGVGDLGTELRAADSVITTRIENLSIVGDGLVTASRAGDTWTLSVNSLHLSNTLTGAVDPVVGTPAADAGDIYINTTDGGTFIFTGTAWVEMSRAADAVTAVNEHSDGSVTITNPTGPVVTVGVSEALQATIAANTLANTNQQTAIEDLTAEKADKTTQVLGGAGLTGGGALTGDQTLAVGEGAGITVSADLVAVKLSAKDGNILSFDDTPVTGDNGLYVSATNLSGFVTEGASPTGGVISGSYAGGFQIVDGSIKNADVALDAAIAQSKIDGLTEALGTLTAGVTAAATKTELSTAVGNVQAELDATQAGAGLSAAGAYVKPSTSNYLDAATTLAEADKALDTAIKSVETALTGTVGGKANSSVTLTAGAGLTGGGTLEADRTFDIGQGEGISVTDDAVAINRTVTNTWYVAAGTVYTAADITNVPAGDVLATNVQAAINELDGDLTTLAGRVTETETVNGTQTANIATNTANITANSNAITALQSANTAQDTVIASKAVAGSAELSIAENGTETIAEIPALATITVVDDKGCIATLSVCGAGSAGRSFTSNVAFTGTVYWTGL